MPRVDLSARRIQRRVLARARGSPRNGLRQTPSRYGYSTVELSFGFTLPVVIEFCATAVTGKITSVIKTVITRNQRSPHLRRLGPPDFELS